MKYLLLLFSLFVGLATNAQRNMTEINFTVNGEQLSQPYGGGINTPMIFSEDLNNDGKKDLIMFDKSDWSFIAFRNEGVSGEVNYVPDESLLQYFPEDITSFANVVDYNQDGAADIFANSPIGGGGFALYKGYWKGDRLAFEFKTNRIRDTAGLGVYTDATKLPSFTDMNDDGDMDILIFSLSDRLIMYYENLAVERGLPLDSLILKPKSNCWGYMCECSSIDNSITLNYQDSWCYHKLWDGFPGSGGGNANDSRHAGSTLLAFDPDDDGDKDILLGDAGFSNLVKVENGASDYGAEYDSLFRLDTAFPSYDVPIDFNIFPAPYYLDANNDGKKDLLVTTYTYPACYINQIVDTQYNRNIMYYRNEGTGGKDTFRYQYPDFVVGDMVDVGFNAKPAFFDYNNDGLEDIVMGRCYMRMAEQPDSLHLGLVLFENTGTAIKPAYELVTQDYAGLRQFGWVGLSPTFEDTDGDGDEDMILGERGGALFYFENDAPAGQEASFTRVKNYFDGVQQASSSVPFMADVDEDGDFDLLMGERQGRVYYYKNTGSKTSPVWEQESNFWGEVDARLGNYNGYSIPWFGDADGDGERELLVGNLNGQVVKYTDIDGNLEGVFTIADTNYLNVRWGNQIGLDVADINGDGKMDFALGNYRGGLRLMTFAQQPSGVSTLNLEKVAFHVFPNPATDEIMIRLKKGMSGVIKMYNLTGSLVNSEVHDGNSLMRIQVADYPEGIYLVEFSSGNVRLQKKVVIMR